MKLRRFLALLVLATFVRPAGAQAPDRIGPGRPAEADFPPISVTPAPAPAAVLDLLPPGIRPPTKAGFATPRWVAVESDRGKLAIELVGPASSARWLEVEYTVDPDLEAGVRALLEERGVKLGHVILMDPTSGEIFAYLSTDPERFPATRAYPTASLMKVVTAAATFHTAPEATERMCRYVGSPYALSPSYLVPPRIGGQAEPFSRSLAISNNQCFARLAVDDVGEDLLVGEMARVGLLESPARRHMQGRVEPIGDAYDLGLLGSGLAGSFITPLGAARLAAVLAKGELVQPYWIGRVRDESGNLLAVPGRRAPRPVWLPEVADELRGLMVRVTEEGTARSAFRDRHGEPMLGSIQVAGKTGTLGGTDPVGNYQWFIGVAPAAAPSIAVAAVVVSEPPHHSSAAALAAAALRLVFCEGSDCSSARGERLHARAAARDAEDRAAVAAVVEAELHRREELLRVYEVDDLDYAPKVLTNTELQFPDHLLERRIRGKIVVAVDLDRSGDVVDARIDSSSLANFDEFVLGEVSKWKFTPPVRNGQPVNAQTRVPLNIRIR